MLYAIQDIAAIKAFHYNKDYNVFFKPRLIHIAIKAFHYNKDYNS